MQMRGFFLLIFSLYVLCSAADLFCNPSGVRIACCTDCSPSSCASQGCCFQNSTDSNPGASCFKSNPPVSGYTVTSAATTAYGYELTLTLSQGGSFYGTDLTTLQVTVWIETADRLHVKIYDPTTTRWEVPYIIQVPPPPTKAPSTNYIFNYTTDPFSFSVVRRSTGEVLFNTSTSSSAPFNNLVFEDQYLEISTQLPEKPNIYGLGERVHPLRLSTDRLYTMFNLDEGTPLDKNLYGSHAFYIDLRQDTGNANGVFLLNSNGMDVFLANNSLTYRVIGGVLDFYFFQGPTPENVVIQYLELIGNPHMPPYWGLGWNQCRWGYNTIQETEQVVKNYSLADIPLDTMWNDIDYMYEYYDFTFDPIRFPVDIVNQFVNQLHQDGQHYIVIVDCGIPNVTGYDAWDLGLQDDLFIKNNDGTPFIGQVWPGFTAWPDFYNPNTTAYWQYLISNFLKLVPVDGLWIDMNEISNFCSGECTPSVRAKAIAGSNGFNPNTPPYAINNGGSQLPLEYHTVTPDSLHYNNVLEYNLHNMFGILEANATKKALENIRNERSVVIGRSTFPGDGHIAAHWLGDNNSDWPDLYLAIPGILNFQFFGIPLVGADICGFGGNTTEELCARWMEVGAFYPFARNHNAKGSIPQEPYRWPVVANISRVVLRIRYSFLPFYYTQFYNAHVNGGVVAKPFFFLFPTDPVCADLDTQFMIGDGLLISPVLEPNVSRVEAYFPQGVWYDYYNYSAIVSKDKGQWVSLYAPLEVIPLHLRGGTIIPSQIPGNTTTATRLNPFFLLVPLNLSGEAQGELYWDDGVSLFQSQDNKEASVLINYQAGYNGDNGKVTATVEWNNLSSDLELSYVTILGVSQKPSSVVFNGQSVEFDYKGDTGALRAQIGQAMFQQFTLTWQ